MSPVTIALQPLAARAPSGGMQPASFPGHRVWGTREAIAVGMRESSKPLQCPSPAMCRDTFHWTRVLPTLSSLASCTEDHFRRCLCCAAAQTVPSLGCLCSLHTVRDQVNLGCTWTLTSSGLDNRGEPLLRNCKLMPITFSGIYLAGDNQRLLPELAILTSLQKDGASWAR